MMPVLRPDGEIALSARGVGKRFHIGTRADTRLFRQLVAWCGGIASTRPLWAVRGVDLQVRRGECVGLIGLNGAGKTTLLQMLAGVLAPTEGDVQAAGRVSAFFQIASGTTILHSFFDTLMRHQSPFFSA